MLNFRKIDTKWQKYWEKIGLFKAKNFSKKPKFYVLDMFPYPSGAGLHVGHLRGYTASDVIFRYLLMKGYNVLHPMGWDAFGLPAENYAIKTGIHPAKSTAQNIKKFKKQLKSAGLGYDWDREINTTDPNYYKWTQWIFLKMFEKGLAYEAIVPINWCPSCKTSLANEEVQQGKCERCGSEVYRRNLRQWMLKITAYAERLLKDLEELDWPEKIKTLQKNWIGRSEGTDVKFKIKDSDEVIEVFTTRIDTIFGVTALVIAPEHELILKLKDKIQNYKEVESYIEQSKRKSELERISLIKEKTGVELKGIKAIHPFTNKEIPVWVADYVIGSYGGGSVMVVPAHDQRDFEFAQKYSLPIIEVIKPFPNEKGAERGANGELLEAFEKEGILINSLEFSGLSSKEAKEKITQWLTERGLGNFKVNYKLRDWIFSRQRYWGEPIPIIKCEKCGNVPLDEKDLPLLLPKVKKYQPSGTGESPLATIEKWVNVKCPKCKGPARRETNTMPQWAGSCWYYLRYLDPKNKKVAWDKKIEKYWMPVDLYIGGAEHAVLHLLYARFWHKFLYDLGLVSTKEPFKKLRNQGIILGMGGEKMSKSKGNVINPDEIIKKYGADVLRVYEMFMGPFDQAIVWSTEAIEGVNRFLHKVYRLVTDYLKKKQKQKFDFNKELRHKTIKKVTEDIENFKFNTAISTLMEYVNLLSKDLNKVILEDLRILILLLAPFAPHLAEELWQKISQSKKKKSIFKEKWPSYDPKLVKEKEIELIIQINGRLRDKVIVNADISEDEAKNLALNREKIKKYLAGQKIKKIIFVPGKLINFVI
jgi:leucyl-tRNA synthetase